MEKPCDSCGIAQQEAIDFDEVTCYKTCDSFKEWQEENVE